VCGPHNVKEKGERERERGRCLGEFILQANIDLGQDLPPLHVRQGEQNWPVAIGQSKLEGLLNSHSRWRKGKQRGDQKRERE
jgi:hypothetical protein